jgi:diguanylate cyclase (GGDEF)-like protein/PAS domain S-box-containing protein
MYRGVTPSSHEIAQQGPSLDGALREVVRGLAGVSGSQFFRRLCEQLGATLGAAYAGVAQLADDRQHARLLGLWSQHQEVTATEFSIVGSAAESAVDGEVVIHSDRVRAAFPGDQRLARLACEAYMAVPVVDGSGDVLGWIEMAFRAPMTATEPAETILALMADRVVAEIEREEAEAALRDSEMRYRALIDDSFHLVAEIVDERYIYVSAGYTETLGFEPEEVLGGSIFDLIHQDDRRAVAAEMQVMTMERRAAHFTVRFHHKGGGLRWLECTARAFRASSGESRTTLFSRDITERLAAEDALRESEHRFRALINDLHVGVLVYDPQAKILVANQAASTLLGLTQDQLLGRASVHPAWNAVREDGSPFPAESFPSATAINSRKPVRDVVMGVYRPLLDDRVWLLVNAEPQFNHEGAVYQVIVSFSDITARLVAERDLQESEVRFRLLAEHSTDLIGRYAVDGTCLWISPSSTAVLGYGPEELIGTNPGDHVHEEDLSAVKAAMQTMVERAAPATATFRFRHKNGSYVWLEARGKAITDEHGVVVEVQSSTRDVSARIERQARLEESEEHFRLLAENASDVIVRFDPDGVCKWISPSISVLAGWEPEELVGTLLRPFLHPDDLGEAMQRRDAVLSSSDPVTGAFRFRRKDGAYLVLDSTSRSIRDSQTGEVVEIQLAARDITRRAEAEDSLRRGAELFEVTLNSVADAVIVTRPGSEVLLWNSRAIAMLEIPEEVVQSRRASGLVEHLLTNLENPQALIEAVGPQFEETPRDMGIWRSKAGRSFEAFVHPIPRDVGGYLRVWSIRDVTDRLASAQAMQENELRLRAVINSAPLIIAQINADGVIALAAGEGLASVGMSPDSLIGRSVRDVLAEYPDAISFVDHALAGREFSTTVGMNGRIFDAHFSPLVDERGTVTATIAVAYDISARIEAEQALRESDDRFRSLAEHTTDLVLDIRGAGVIDYASPNCPAILGYPAEALAGTNAMDLVQEEDLVAFIDVFQRAAEAQTSAGSVLRAKHSDGRLCWMDITCNFFLDEVGELRAVVTARDVTQRRLAEDALRDSEQQIRALADTAPLLLVSIGTDRRFRVAQGQLLTALDRTTEDFIGRPIADILARYPDTIAEVDRALAGEEVSSSLILRNAVFETHFRPQRDDAGEIIGVIGVAFDITSRRQAERALQESEETTRALLNAPTDGAVLVDREGTILAYNATAEKRFHEHAANKGIDAGSFVGACVFDIFSDELRDQRKARNDEVFATGQRRHFEDERDGVWTDVTLDPVFDSDGNVVRLAIFSRDITDRKRDEAALKKRSRELEALNDYLEKQSAELERSQFELREASEQLAQLLDAEQARAKTDPLTGALNHGAISEVITESMAAEMTFAVAMVDVDGMKAINDTFGHQAGDSVLKAVTAAITRAGAIAGRYGGDEFLVALLSASREEAERYKNAVDAELRDAHVIDPETGAHVPVVASVGIAVYPDDGPTLPELVEHADEQMYVEKRARQGAGSGLSSSRMLGGERAARMVGELVSLLTSAEPLEDKLRLVSHRLSVGAGYAGVSFDVFAEAADQAEEAQETAHQNAFTKAPQEMIDAWNEQQRSGNADLGVGDLLRETRKPLLLDNIEESAYVTEDQRRLLAAVGIRSGIVVPLFIDDDMIATMSVGSKELAGFSMADEQFLTAVAAQVAAIIRMARLVEHLQQATDRLEESRDETVMLLAAAAEAHSHTGGKHFENVRDLSEMIAREMGFEDEALRELGLAAALHDIGKIYVPDALLSSPDRVSPHGGAPEGRLEWETLKEHCTHGREFLSRTAGFELAARVAYAHHERWDGAGYPDGLAGDEIPVEAAIIAVADSLDAMLTDRAYKAGRPLDAAIAEIAACRGTQFSPDAVDALTAIHDRGGLREWWGRIAADGASEAAAA